MIEALALILKNRTIKFNHLLNVDDPEEAETEDLGLSGKHCLVSCWTKNQHILEGPYGKDKSELACPLLYIDII